MVAVSVSEAQIYAWLAEIADPEIPVLSILDLGIVRAVRVSESGEAIVTITPTYSGCPAMDIISMQIRMVLLGRGLKEVTVNRQLSPAWTTDWLSDAGRERLRAYGIAPPQRKAADRPGLFDAEAMPCPRCGSAHTELISAFGATSCKALFRCLDCLEPFEHFKCH